MENCYHREIQKLRKIPLYGKATNVKGREPVTRVLSMKLLILLPTDPVSSVVWYSAWDPPIVLA